MRHLGILLLAACPAVILAQTPVSDQRVLETLLSEVQQLRMAIERQTLLGTRTQIAIGQLQLQEGRAAAMEKELAMSRDAAMQMKTDAVRTAAVLKELEQKRSLGASTPQARDELDDQIKQMKFQLERSSARGEQLAAREGDLTSQFQAVQRDVQDSRSRIAEMERALDAAIQQMLKGK